jgi:hypothetical protein
VGKTQFLRDHDLPWIPNPQLNPSFRSAGKQENVDSSSAAGLQIDREMSTQTVKTIKTTSYRHSHADSSFFENQLSIHQVLSPRASAAVSTTGRAQSFPAQQEWFTQIAERREM